MTAKTFIYAGIAMIIVGTVVWIYGDKLAHAL